ncbi:MAG: hypothetical protein A4E19_15470 [Nitrospira sp. SG-bin1]|nr:MAG: hypothetical protein A4E19_15470 [Nitrospira sp. SG-bin1]
MGPGQISIIRVLLKDGVIGQYRAVFSAMRLCVAGMWLMLFELTRDILTDILYAAADEHFSWDLNPHKSGRIDPSILGIELIDIQTHRSIGKPQGIKRGGISHGYSKMTL